MPSIGLLDPLLRRDEVLGRVDVQLVQRLDRLAGDRVDDATARRPRRRTARCGRRTPRTPARPRWCRRGRGTCRARRRCRSAGTGCRRACSSSLSRSIDLALRRGRPSSACSRSASRGRRCTTRLATMITSSRLTRARVAARRRRSMFSLIERVFLDVDVALRDVRLGLVVVVVADEVVDGVVREEALELLVELGGERLVVGEDERRLAERGDDVGGGERLAGAGGAEQHLEVLAAGEALSRVARWPSAGRRPARTR